MSQANVQVVREVYDELARGNHAPLRDCLDPQIVYWLREDDPEPGPHHGLDTAMEFIMQPAELLAPLPGYGMVVRPASPVVHSARHEGPDCLALPAPRRSTRDRAGAERHGASMPTD
jgi:ketosteroid isomerase-like protein